MDLNLSCRCGKIKGVAKNVIPALTGRIICLCDDCQAYAHYLKKPEVLDENGGTEVVPLYPADIEFKEGKEFIRCVRLKPHRGLYRWYAGCCGVPLVNIPPSSKIPYAGVIHTFIEGGKKVSEEKFGKVKGRINGRYGKGRLPPGTHQKVSPGFLVKTIIPFVLTGKIMKKHSPSPFFDKSRKPTCHPVVLSEEELELLKK